MPRSLGDGIRAAGADQASGDERCDALIDYMKSQGLDWMTALDAAVKLVEPGLELTAISHFTLQIECEAGMRKARILKERQDAAARP